MRKNKLTLTAGILMVVVASLSIVLAIEYISWSVECGKILYEMIDSLSVENIGFVLETMELIGFSIICIVEAILYMIWGVKLIKKTNNYTPIANMRKWLIVIIVFSYIFAFLHLENLINILSESGIFLAIAIILNVAVAQSGEKKVVNHNNYQKGNNNLDSHIIERMNSIKKLKEDNIISEEEYQKLRDKILGDIINIDTKDNE